MKYVSVAALALSALFGAAGAGILPPAEVTPEIVAERGCIEGVSHPSEDALNFDAQAKACDDYVRLWAGDADARRMRAWHYYDHGSERIHFEIAYEQLSDLIKAGEGKAVDYYYRGHLLALKFGQPRAAIADYDAAILLRQDSPRAQYHFARAAMHLQLGDAAQDPAELRAGIADLEMVKALGKGNARVAEHMAWAKHLLNRLEQVN